MSGAHIPELASVPLSIRDQRRWIVWRYISKPGRKKPAKVPSSCVTARAGEWNAGEHMWVTAAEAIAFAREHDCNGIGLILGSGIIGIDFDNCTTRSAGKIVIAPWAQAILQLKESFTEISVSGEGFHILARGEAPDVKAGDCELYGGKWDDGKASRFFTFSGKWQRSTPAELAPAPKTIAAARVHIEGAKVEAARKKAETDAAKASGPSSVPANRVGQPVVAPIASKATAAEPAISATTKVAADEGDAAAPLTLDGRTTPSKVLNVLALRCADKWLREIMPDAKREGDGWRGTAPGTSSSGNFSLHIEKGARWHSGESNGRVRDSMSPIDVVLEWAEGVETHADAVDWLCQRLGLDGDTLTALKTMRRKADAAAGPRDVFQPRLVPPATWPAGTLPAPVEAYADNLAAVHGQNAPAVKFVLLAASAAAVPASVRGYVAESGWVFPAALYALIIAPSGSRKSPLMRAALAPVAALDDAERARAKRECRAALVRLVQTSTTEGLQLRMQQVQAGIIYDADEVTGLIGALDKYSGSSRGGSTDSAFFLSAFDGGAYSVSRKTANLSVEIGRTHLAILAGAQPDVIGPLLENLSGDGLMQRFVVAHLHRSDGGARALVDPILRDGYVAIVQAIATCGGMAGEHHIAAEAGATSILWDTEEWARDEMRARHVTPALGSSLGKSHGMIARIALTIELADWAAREVDERADADALGDDAGRVPILPARISTGAVERAATLYREFLWPELRRLYVGAGAGSTLDADVRQVASVILDHREAFSAGLSARDVTRKCNRFRNAAAKERLWAALDELVEAGWLNPIPKTEGAPPRYEVSPAVYDGRFA